MDFKPASACPPIGGCVTVKRDEQAVAIRDSKNPNGPTLTFTRDEWDAFIAGAKNGEFDVG